MKNSNEYFTLSKTSLRDKILGAWVGKSYGAMMGEPMEFDAQGEIYEGSLDIHPDAPKIWLHNEDDLYTNMAFLEILRDHGLHATQDNFADVFRKKDFMLWHANGQARQNLLEGIPPGLSGHPYYNPHADDIDFQIECDFIGIISPGLSDSSQKISDKVGHIMNFGDGYYAGAFLAAMYAYAYLGISMVSLIKKALKVIPDNCDYSLMINELIKWYDEEPEDWRVTWKNFEQKWNHDLCPWAQSDPPSKQGNKEGLFNIQGHFNGIYILIGLLYGKGDFLEAIKICTRCGQDTDSNVANCGGVMGLIYGYEKLPDEVKAELNPYMDRNYNYTSLSINSATELSYELAIQNIIENGGKIEGDEVLIKPQHYIFNGDVEISFPNLKFENIYTIEPNLSPELKWNGDWKQTCDHRDRPRFFSSNQAGDYLEVEFSGNCVYVQGNMQEIGGILEIFIDGELMQTRDMYVRKEFNNSAQATAAWITNLSDGSHTMKIMVTGRCGPAASDSMISLGRVISYSGKVALPV